MSSARPAVLLLSSLVVRGSVGGRGALFALERRGHRVWLVPTVLLPWHPGHGRGTRLVAPAAEFASLVADLATSPHLGQIGGVLTGYFATADQVAAAAGLIDAIKARNPACCVLCDPVIGDLRADGSGGLYVAEATAAAIRDHLLPRASLATPNRFELGWLTGLPVATTAEAITAARALGPAATVVTSAPAMMAGAAATLLVEATAATQAEHPLLPGAPHGTGDLFAALLLSEWLAGTDPGRALDRTTAAVFDMVARSVRAGADELSLAAEQDVLEHSLAQVTLRRIGDARRPVRPPPRSAPLPSTPPDLTPPDPAATD